MVGPLGREEQSGRPGVVDTARRGEQDEREEEKERGI